MVNQNIVKYMREGQKRGFKIPLLRQKLLEGGFKKKNIDEAAVFVQKMAKPVARKAPVVQRKPIMPSARGVSRPVRKVAKPVVRNVEKPVEKSSNGKLGMFGKIGKAFAHPIELFEKTKGEGVFSSLKYLWFISLVPFILGGLVIFLFLGVLVDWLVKYAVTSGLPAGTVTLTFTTVQTLLIILGWGVYLFIITPILMLIGNGIMHLFIKLFKGRGSYADTFRSFVYASTPAVIFMVIPFVNSVVGIWTFILSLFGLSINHEISKLRAFLALLVGGLVVGIIGSILVFVIGMFFVPSVPI